jgi:hypothetical protein
MLNESRAVGFSKNRACELNLLERTVEHKVNTIRCILQMELLNNIIGGEGEKRGGRGK